MVLLMLSNKRLALLFMLLHMHLLLHLPIIPTIAEAAAAAATTAPLPTAKPGCPDKCGNVTIPYPFGIRGNDNCFLPGFDVTCDNSSDPPTPFVHTGNTEIIDISLFPAEVRVLKFVAYNCFDQERVLNRTASGSMNFTGEGLPYRFSNTRNKFTAIGCYTVAYISGQNSKQNFTSGCAAFCDSVESATDGSCSGIGCCQTTIPKEVNYYEVQWGFPNYNPAWEFNPCSYAVLMEEDSYNFTASDLPGNNFLQKNENGVPMVLDWAVRDRTTCPEAKNGPDYACLSKSSDCYNSANGAGYLCKCLAGYEGNPYLPDGCIDINECELKQKYPCYGECNNLPGSYNCTCAEGFRGNATTGSCSKIPEKFPLSARLAVGASVTATILLSLCCFILLKLQKRRYIKEKDDYFKQNGGLQLYEEMRKRQVDTIDIFTEMELESATNNFAKDTILGCGGRGMVYKGILEKNREVAIKKSKIVGKDQKEEFVNEIIILSQINHKNVVRLLGCCLEVDVPMLVYEFISNGTLYDFLHGENGTSCIPLDTRLKIAVESADALAYLHSSTSRSILHGDVKSLNILLDENYEAKVSDFGASKLVPLDEAEFVMFVQGTLGYLDPECLYNHQLTEKSDVYSFGVVLLELITRKKAIYVDDSNEKKNLASSFISMINQDKLQDILDDQIKEDGAMDVLQEVADIAMQCLKAKGEERPTMKEVREGLQMLIRFKQHPWGQKNPEEAESLLGGELATYTASDSIQYHSLENRMVLDIEAGR